METTAKVIEMGTKRFMAEFTRGHSVLKLRTLPVIPTLVCGSSGPRLRCRRRTGGPFSFLLSRPRPWAPLVFWAFEGRLHSPATRHPGEHKCRYHYHCHRRLTANLVAVGWSLLVLREGGKRTSTRVVSQNHSMRTLFP